MSKHSRRPGRKVVVHKDKTNFFANGFAMIDRERVDCPHKFPFRNRKEMAQKLGISIAQLDGPKVNPDNLSEVTLNALKLLGFDPHDVKFTEGSLKEFVEWYLACNSFDPDNIEWPGDDTEDPPPEHKYGMQFEPIESAQPKMAMATIDFGGSSSEDGRHFEIVLSFNCIEDDLGQGVQYGLRNAQLYLSQGVGEVVEQAGLDKPIVVKREKGELTIKAMGLKNPTAWRIESSEGVIGYFNANSPMCTIKPVEPIKNDEIELQMIIYCSDLVPFAADEDLEGDGFSTAFALLGRANINVAKQRILERLANLPMFPGDADYKVICRVKRRVMSR